MKDNKKHCLNSCSIDTSSADAGFVFVVCDRWYGPELATFDESCRKLMGCFNAILPEGSLKVRVRCTTRESKNLKETSLGETLGDESAGMVQSFRAQSRICCLD